jgi:hypothetical protein
MIHAARDRLTLAESAHDLIETQTAKEHFHPARAMDVPALCLALVIIRPAGQARCMQYPRTAELAWCDDNSRNCGGDPMRVSGLAVD